MSSSDRHQISLGDIAVIIAAKNEQAGIQACLKSVIAAARSQAEIWVVDDGSTDDTLRIIQSFLGVKILQGNGKGPSHARNLAMKSTTRSYVAFTDADAEASEDWLFQLCETLHGREKKFVAAGGAQRGFNDAVEWESFHSRFLEHFGSVSDYIHDGTEIREVSHNPTCNVLYDRKIVLEAGGFDEHLWPCEDLDLDLRLQKIGYFFLFNPKAIIFHHRAKTPNEFSRMMKRYGFGHAQIVKKHGVCQKIHLLPFFAIAALIAMILLLLQFWFLTGGLFLVLGFWMMLVASDSTKFLMNKTMYAFYAVPSMIYWNIGFFTGIFQKKKITRK